ncbi:MAG: patatin-like phospholipase family protein [Mariprofundaceae bacterium]|nr:patatin-like phospholipase family protein [Mariprofundaceae bacterium]
MAVKIILSLDGGGIRGAATAQFLSRLESDLGSSLYNTFDLFAGTSTGGIIAGAIGLLQKRGVDLPDLYNYENANRIMNKSAWDRMLGFAQTEPRYDGSGKIGVLTDYFGEKKLNDADKPVLVVTYDVEKRKSDVLKSNGDQVVKAVDAFNATSAAPLYFPTAKVAGDNVRWLIDGGVIANNPAMCAYAEAVSLWGRDDEIRMLSVGTGSINRKIDGKQSQGYGALGWINHDLLGITMDESVVEYQAKVILGDNYLRVNSELHDVNDDMDDVRQKNINDLIKLGDRWYETFGDQAVALLTR